MIKVPRQSSTSTNIQARGVRIPEEGATTHCCTTGQDDAGQEALSPRLTATGRRLVQRTI
jgi:hypothetical protein